MALSLSRTIVTLISSLSCVIGGVGAFSSRPDNGPLILRGHPSPCMAMLSTQDASTTGSGGDEVSIRVLCLHGKGGSEEQFVNSALMPLRSLVNQRVSGMCDDDVQSKVSFQWEALTAPFELQPGDETAGYSWWTMPPGVRSYNAEEYIGFDESASMVMDKLYPDDTACAFDIILGHSQGAILTAALLAIKPELQSTSNAPLGYILNGVAWPNPYRSNLTSLAQQQSGDYSGPRLAFVMGKNDSINPIESAVQVHEAYGRAAFDVSIVHHEGGHSVPLGRDEDSIRALEALVDWIMEIARLKARRMSNES